MHVVLAVGGLVVFFASENLAVRIIGLLVSTAGSMGVGTNTHTSSHYATSERRWVNEALTFFGYPFFLGLSATFWWNKHVVVHHPAPNVIDVDDDADFMPWLALTDRDLGRAGTWRRFYYQHLQWWLFPIVLAGNGFNMGRAGLTYVIGGLRGRETVANGRTGWTSGVSCFTSSSTSACLRCSSRSPRRWWRTRCALH